VLLDCVIYCAFYSILFRGAVFSGHGVEYWSIIHLTQSRLFLEAIFTTNHLTNTDKQYIIGKYTNQIQLKKQMMHNTAKKLF